MLLAATTAIACLLQTQAIHHKDSIPTIHTTLLVHSIRLGRVQPLAPTKSFLQARALGPGEADFPTKKQETPMTVRFLPLAVCQVAWLPVSENLTSFVDSGWILRKRPRKSWNRRTRDQTSPPRNWPPLYRKNSMLYPRRTKLLRVLVAVGTRDILAVSALR
jgi:hypothetical protein